MSSNLIRIFVNNQKLFTISRYTTIYLFKKEIKKNIYNNVKTDDIVLKHNNKILQNNNTLYYYDMKDNDNIDIILPLKGGSYNSKTTEKRLKIAYVPVWGSTFIFFISGIPVILSIILTNYFKKQFKNPFVKFIIQLTQMFILFWIVLIMITIICIPIYSFFIKTNCKLFENSTSNGWYGALIFLLCYILIFFFDIFNIFTITEGSSELETIIDTTKNIYETIQKTHNNLLLKILLSINPFTRIIDEGIGYLYDSMKVIGNINIDNINIIKIWLESDKIQLDRLIEDKKKQKGGEGETSQLNDKNIKEIIENLLDYGKPIKNTLKQEDIQVIIENIDNLFTNYPSIIKLVQDFLKVIVNNITKQKLRLSLQVGVPLSILVICFTLTKILWDLIWVLFG